MSSTFYYYYFDVSNILRIKKLFQVILTILLDLLEYCRASVDANIRMCAQMTLQNQALGSDGVTILNLAIVCDVAGHLRRHPSAASCGRWKAAKAGRHRTRNASASVNGHGARTASTRHAPRMQSHTPATWASAAARPLPGPRKSRCLDSPQSSLELHHYHQSEHVHIT